MLYLPEEWLRSTGIRSFPLDRSPNVINTWRQFLFLYSRSVELIVGGKKILRINGMADDSYAQVCLNPNQAVKKSGKDVLKKLIKVFQKLEKFRVFTLGVLNHSKCYFSTPNIKMRPPSNVLFTKILQDFFGTCSSTSM